ncbi:ABC transporter ATP-binding protein [Methanogenium organophilum]|uniref:ABC transporter ATP-binding protein n=1 Tax=Methanogenium organophilum TaxID=2199 RepID=A0A9X9S6F4_METOG|nr:ABC transporter ATP-binding protein [Methanogenium organophilum]WAI02567.1 ABC transporter ATP-binding protein [Methanogenium organophilum]
MIEARKLVKDYGTFRALDEVSFSFEDPGIFGIIGHNGAGKTTLLKCMAGLIRPTAGDLVIEGIDVRRDPARLKETLGYLPEESRLYETMTVENYLRFFGEIYGIPADECRLRSEELLTSLKLDSGGKRIGELSKGMRRKVAIARSLLHKPSLLIYDEPTSGLDPMTSRYIIDYLAHLRDRCRKTILLSAHNLYQVEKICDQVLILRQGKVAAFGTMDELREDFGSLSYQIRFVAADVRTLPPSLTFKEEGGEYVAVAESMDDLNLVTAAVASAGGTVRRIESRYLSLEEMLLMIGK